MKELIKFVFNQSNSSFQIWQIVSYIGLNTVKATVFFLSSSAITHRVAWTISTAIPENSSVPDLSTLMAEILCCMVCFTLWSAAPWITHALLKTPALYHRQHGGSVSQNISSEKSPNMVQGSSLPPVWPRFCWQMLAGCMHLLSSTGCSQASPNPSLNFA